VVDHRATKGVTDDAITSWSSRGITANGFAKPEIYAPAPNSAFASICPECVVNGGDIGAGGGDGL
jgi:hypothetical protein